MEASPRELAGAAALYGYWFNELGKPKYWAPFLECGAETINRYVEYVRVMIRAMEGVE